MSPRFEVGASVRVRNVSPPGHLRTPFYIRGCQGVVERICGPYRNPEELAYGNRQADRVPLYRVRFAQHHIWPDYYGPEQDTVDVELYEFWLEPTSENAHAA